MDAAELRAMQTPIKDRYKSDPGAALITLKAKGTLDDSHIAGPGVGNVHHRSVIRDFHARDLHRRRTERVHARFGIR